MPHAPSRRDVMLASGTLFAWASMPKLALAEGRDPRFLMPDAVRKLILDTNCYSKTRTT